MSHDTHPPVVAPPLTPQATSTSQLSLDAHLDMLRGVTRQLATASDAEAVLHSIVAPLAERAGAVMARIFLHLHDHECSYCRERIAAGKMTASRDRAMHLVASAGAHSERGGLFHRIPLDSPLPTSEIMRTRAPMLVEDWRRDARTTRDADLMQLWRELGVVGIAAYPLDFRGELLGTLGVLVPRRLVAAEFALLEIFADQAAMAIKSANLFAELGRHRDQLQVENTYLQAELREDRGFENIVGESPALSAVLRRVRQVASVDTTVLLNGETGTGKELVARAIHDGSPRRERPMIKVNCGAIPQNLVESELFGHEKGAFTGALQKRVGRFELADRGTLFMDEAGELPLDTQVKLLRVLQEREFERVGSAKVTKVDVRLVAATHRDLDAEVREGRFRADLFYRLNVFPIRIPPLRERPEDIPLLVEHFLKHFQRKLGKSLRSVAPSSLEQMRRYPWPGNVRELQNVLERACVLASGPVVELAQPLRAAPTRVASIADVPLMTLDDSERAHIRRALAATNGRIHGPTGAAALLGINPSTLRSRMEKLEIAKSR
jgi:formate hydrogenlyase transcriptional activator